MNKFLLWLAMLPGAIWKAMGADLVQLRAILRLKLTIDDRRPLSIAKPRKQSKKRSGQGFLNIFLSIITGIGLVLVLAFIHDATLALTLFYSLFAFLLTFMLITDFSNILFDPRDRYTVLCRPVGDRTLFLSKMIHIGVYLFRIVVPMSLPAWVVIGIRFGWGAALWFPIPLFLFTLLVLFLVQSMYLLIMRLASPSRFKDVINAFQIVFSIFFFATYYLLPKITDYEEAQHLTIDKFLWLQSTPFYWFAATYQFAIPHMRLFFSPFLVYLLAFGVPVFLAWLAVRFIAPGFVAKLGDVFAEGGESVATVTKTTARNASPSRLPLYKRISIFVNKKPIARSGFDIAWLLTGRSRTFRMRVLPTFAYVPIYFIYLLSINTTSIAHAYEMLPTTNKFLILLYMCGFPMLQALNNLTFSEQYKAAWIYYASPVSRPGSIMGGAYRALWVRYFLPFFIVISAFVLWLWGIERWIDVLLALVNITLFTICVARLGFRSLPFSRLEQMKNAGGKIFRTLASMFIPFALGFGHYAVLGILWLKVLFLILSSGFLLLVWDSYINTAWSDVIAQEA